MEQFILICNFVKKGHLNLIVSSYYNHTKKDILTANK